MNTSTIAAAMRRQADTAGLSERRLSGGLLVRFSRAKDGTRVLLLMRKQPGPSASEREQWRKAFGVPLEVFEYKGLVEIFDYAGLDGKYIYVQWEWKVKDDNQ